MRPSKVNFRLVSESEKIVERKTGADLVKAYNSKNLCHPGKISQTRTLRLQLHVCEALQDVFEMIDLSPVSVLGTNSVLAGISQKTVLSALRDVEVIADPTTSLALEAVRRKGQELGKGGTLRLASCMRILRLQNFQNNPGFSNHFLALGMISADTDRGHRSFEIQELKVHIESSLRAITSLKEEALHKIVVYYSDTRVMHSICRLLGIDVSTLPPMSRQGGFSAFDFLNVKLPRYATCPSEIVDRTKFGNEFCRAMNDVDFLWRSAITALSEQYPNIEFVLHLDRSAGINYYSGPCFKIRAQNKEGEIYPLTDGGRVDWASRLTGSKKARMFSTGIGLELLEKQFM